MGKQSEKEWICCIPETNIMFYVNCTPRNFVYSERKRERKRKRNKERKERKKRKEKKRQK